MAKAKKISPPAVKPPRKKTKQKPKGAAASAPISTLAKATPLSTVRPVRPEERAESKAAVADSQPAAVEPGVMAGPPELPQELNHSESRQKHPENAPELPEGLAEKPAEAALEAETEPVGTPMQQVGAEADASVSTLDTTPSADMPGKSSRRKLPYKTLLRRSAIVLVVLAILAAAGYLLVLKRESPQTADQRLVAKVARLAVVPKDETPAISTVVDESKISQEFLRTAKKGDKVLMYMQAGRAIVYRPSTGQIVNMGPMQTPKPRVFVRAGDPRADTSGIAATIERSAGYQLASTDASPHENYQHTTVIDLTGIRPDVTKQLAAELHATVGQLPANESRPDADILVIVGSDQTK